MEIPAGTQHAFPKSLLLSASILALWVPQGSWAALHIQKIPEQPQMNQDLLLSVQGIPNTFQDFSWYLGEEAHGGTMLFTYIPKLLRPQRDGSAMNQRDIVGFSNGSMLLRRAQPSDSGTYQVAVTINPSWTMRAKTEVQVVEKPKELPVTNLPVSAGIVAAIVIGSLATGCILVGSIAYLLVTRGWRAQNHRITTTEKPELGPSHHAVAAAGTDLSSASGDDIYEAMPSPVLLVSPLGDMGPMNTATPPDLPLPPPPPPPLPEPEPEPEHHPYQDLLNPDPAPYCQLVPAP
ncbi:cell adhesion molecule CEACAM19 isoform 1-T1 [Dama dama]|uniref:carcinoembryonic antigen-related cell adhesion molecule 19 isoform X1 n=1 Tax=Dama dama TaxID=30532 RepID=UPI002A35BE2B|nr:carcinoembryonic antigen-related cell adhesion molecule 19 isoform X1 [Dama dama]